LHLPDNQDYPSGFHHMGENRFDKAKSNQWLKRFDD
jgi:hypothetical protein